MKTTIISFSSRKNGNCAQVGEYIKTLVKNSVLFKFSEFRIHPCGGCKYECFTKESQCPYIEDMEHKILDSIIESEMVYFILPNYNDFPCANFYIFNERSQCYFQYKHELSTMYKKVPKHGIVLSNTNEENFIKALASQTEDEPDVLFLSARKMSRSAINVDLLANDKVIADIRNFVRKHYF